MSATRPWVIALAAALCAATLGYAADAEDIFTAARLGDVERVASLLDAEPGLVNTRNARAETPLHYAAAGQQAAVVSLLLERGADVAAADEQGWTALHLVAASRDAKLIGVVLGAGADVDARSADGETALHVAARRLHVAAMRLLLEAGADANAQSKRGQSPLHVLGLDDREGAQRDAAVRLLADLLVEHGADPMLLDDEGVAALQGRREELPRSRDDYRTYAEIEQLLRAAALAHPSICEFHDIGTSVQGRHLWAVNISDNVGVEEDEPEFKYVSTMHGDEWVGNEMCLFLIDDLLNGYGIDPTCTNLVDEIDIWILPVMNPDGFDHAGYPTRSNANGIDLNRHFPEWMNGDPNTTVGQEPEIIAVMDWTFANSFTLSANLHTGALVVNYPFDNDGLGSVFSPSPDEDLFVYISEEYSQHNSPMWNGSFYHGITNGAAWYSIDGGMQDWHYRYMGCNEVTLELSNTKIPSYSQIPTYWSNNKQSMLSYMVTCLMGVRGIITDANTGAPLAATVTVVGRDHEIYSDPDVGDYHRMLMPGSYDLTFASPGYEAVTLPVTVSEGDATRLDVQLSPAAQVAYPNGGESLVANQPIDVTWFGNPTAEFHVQYTGNYGETGVTSDDFESGVLGPEYTTGGDATWSVTSGTSHTGSYAAQAGTITHNKSTWMTRMVSGGDVSFWYRVSSESNYDFFNFYVDGQRQLHASGNGNWALYTTTLTPGPHELKWEYKKDVSVSSYSDTAWIDDLTLMVDQTVWTDIVALTPPGSTSASWTPTDPGPDYKVRVRAHYGGGVYCDWDESDGTFTVSSGPVYPLGDMDCDGDVDFDDINPFVLALSGETAYKAEYPDCVWLNADCDEDGDVDFDDINPFVAQIGG